jgi:hypothetical protein
MLAIFWCLRWAVRRGRKHKRGVNFFTFCQHVGSRHFDSRHFDSRHFDSRHFDSRHFDSRHLDSQHFGSQHFDARHFGTWQCGNRHQNVTPDEIVYVAAILSWSTFDPNRHSRFMSWTYREGPCLKLEADFQGTIRKKIAQFFSWMKNGQLVR